VNDNECGLTRIVANRFVTVSSAANEQFSVGKNQVFGSGGKCAILGREQQSLKSKVVKREGWGMSSTSEEQVAASQPFLR
jgi:hypothetical protein